MLVPVTKSVQSNLTSTNLSIASWGFYCNERTASRL